jgi:hypothetical protein
MRDYTITAHFKNYTETFGGCGNPKYIESLKKGLEAKKGVLRVELELGEEVKPIKSNLK